MLTKATKGLYMEKEIDCVVCWLLVDGGRRPCRDMKKDRAVV